MQYDENAEKYGYEGEMTPIECDELKPLVFSINDLAYVDEIMVKKNFDNQHDHAVYKATEVDKVLAQKDFEIDRLKEFNAFLKQRVSNGDVNCSTLLDDFEQKDKEIARLNTEIKEAVQTMKSQDVENAELNKKLEDVQASAYAESVDAGMRERSLKRALWLARAEWARSSALSYHLIESHPDKDVAATYKRKANRWEKAKDKCLKKAEEYK